MFSCACNLLKMDASCTDFQQCFKRYLPRNLVNTGRSDQIPASVNVLKHCVITQYIFKMEQNYLEKVH